MTTPNPANGCWRTTLNVRDAAARSPYGSTTSTVRTVASASTAGASHVTEVAPRAPASRVALVPAYDTFTHTRRYPLRKMSSDIDHAIGTGWPPWTIWSGRGAAIETVGGPFAGSPGSWAIRKSDASFVSPQREIRSRTCPGSGAGASERIVFPGSQSRVPPDVALNSTRSTTMSRPAAEALGPPGFRNTSLSASPEGSRNPVPTSTRVSPPADSAPERPTCPPWYVPGRSTSRTKSARLTADPVGLHTQTDCPPPAAGCVRIRWILSGSGVEAAEPSLRSRDRIRPGDHVA